MDSSDYFTPVREDRDAPGPQTEDSDTDMAASATLSSTIPHNLLPSAPASPPTPAPSPTPTQRVPDWSTAAEHEDGDIKSIRAQFGDMNRAERMRLLGELLNLCDSQELSFVAELSAPG